MKSLVESLNESQMIDESMINESVTAILLGLTAVFATGSLLAAALGFSKYSKYQRELQAAMNEMALVLSKYNSSYTDSSMELLHKFWDKEGINATKLTNEYKEKLNDILSMDDWDEADKDIFFRAFETIARIQVKLYPVK